MSKRYNEVAFTPRVLALQETHGSRAAYAKQAERTAGGPVETFGDDERAFIESRDSFYLATVSETGWPYVQHRGGPAGFLRVLGPRTLGFADFGGNRQYVSLGNLETNDRASLFLMDYPTRTRLKIMAHARVVERAGDPDLVDALAVPGYAARVERGFILAVEGFAWNCQQHITPRYTVEEFRALGMIREG